jgi:hypothetical protein
MIQRCLAVSAVLSRCINRGQANPAQGPVGSTGSQVQGPRCLYEILVRYVEPGDCSWGPRRLLVLNEVICLSLFVVKLRNGKLSW